MAPDLESLLSTWSCVIASRLPEEERKAEVRSIKFEKFCAHGTRCAMDTSNEISIQSSPAVRESVRQKAEEIGRKEEKLEAGLHLILGTDPEQREQWELCVVVPGLVPVKRWTLPGTLASKARASHTLLLWKHFHN